MIRRTVGLALALGTATLLWTPGAAQAQCRDLRVATNCTYQDGTCIRGGGTIGGTGGARYFYHAGCY